MHSRKARLQVAEMDILHAHHPFISGRLATRYARAHDLPVVFTNHTRYDLYAQAYMPLVPPVLYADGTGDLYALLCRTLRPDRSSIRGS